MIPHPVTGYTYIGSYLLKIKEHTSSAIYYLYKRNSDEQIFCGEPSNILWEVKLTELKDMKIENFVKFN